MTTRIIYKDRKAIKNINLHDKIMNIMIYDKLKQYVKIDFKSRLIKENKQIIIEFFDVDKIIINDMQHLYEPIGGSCEVSDLELVEENENSNNDIITIKILFFIGSEIMIEFRYLEYEEA